MVWRIIARCLLFLLTFLLCGVVWPIGAALVRPRSILLTHAEEFHSIQIVGPPVLFEGYDREVTVYNWRTGAMNMLPHTVPYGNACLAVDGNQTFLAIKFAGRERLELIDVGSIHEFPTTPLPAEAGPTSILTLAHSGRFGVFGNKKNSTIYVCDLVNRQITDTKPAGRRTIAFPMGGEVEIVTAQPLADPSTYVSERWRVSEEGKLVKSEATPVTRRPVFQSKRFTIDMGLHPNFSGDGEWEAVESKGTIEIRKTTTDESVSSFPMPVRFLHLRFTADARELAGVTEDGDLYVWNTSTGELVHQDLQTRRRMWFLAVVDLTAFALLVGAIALAVTEPTVGWAWIASAVVVILANFLIEQFRVGGNGVAIIGFAWAVGLYLAFGNAGYSWRVFAGLAVLALVKLGIIATDIGERWWDGSMLNSLKTLSIRYWLDAFFFALVGWLGLVPVAMAGRRLTREPAAVKFQLSIGGVMLFTAAIAVFVCFWKQVFPWAVDVIETAVISTMTMLAVYLSTWLWFRSWKPWQFGLLVAAVVVPLAIFITATLMGEERDTWSWSIARVVVPLGMMAFASGFPLWLARRHGYRWHRVQSAPSA